MVVYDRDREDGAFTPREPHGPEVLPSPLPSPNNGGQKPNGQGALGLQEPDHLVQTEWDPLHEMFVTSNPLGNEKALRNPVSHWRVSKKKILGIKDSRVWCHN